mgnify:CR=1 FL=1
MSLLTSTVLSGSKKRLAPLVELPVTTAMLGKRRMAAGGGGFFLFQGSSDIRTQVEKTHQVLSLVMDSAGSTIIFDDGSRL